MHLDRQVWLIEDNAGIHSKAEWVAWRDRAEKGIRKAPWPPNSPDLHPIENLWDYTKDLLSEEPVSGSSDAEKKRFKDLVIKEWQEIDGKVQQMMAGFKDKLERCIAHHGDNNFRA